MQLVLHAETWGVEIQGVSTPERMKRGWKISGSEGEREGLGETEKHTEKEKGGERLRGAAAKEREI